MLKRLIYLAVIILVVLLPFSLMAEEIAIRPVDDVLVDIRQEQGAVTNEQIDVAKISSAKLEELGDSLMEELIGNHTMHERMDARLGGEGSAALTNYHKNLAINFLTGAPLGMIGMMRGNLSGRANRNWPRAGLDGRTGRNMMGYGWSGMGWIGALLMGLAVLVVITLVVFLVVRLSRGPARSGMNSQAAGQPDSSANALGILAERYAKGEINDEEYTRKKAEIRK
jgi:putative membrane protein